jgi:tetratricopeptide (TPR) repeat protein
MAAVLCSSLLVFASDARASYGTSPVGSPTLPPSSYEGGLITTPNPLDNSSNAVITGNVRGGKQFRGPIPYSSSTSFQAALGSTQLDSFLRLSAVPQELGGYSPGYDAFYSPTGTASKIRPGQSGVFAPTSPRVAGGIAQWRSELPADVLDLGDIRQPRVSIGEAASTTDGALDSLRRFGNWPLSGTPEQMREVVSDELGWQLPDGRASQQNSRTVTSEEYQIQMEQFRQQLEKVTADASKLEQSLRVADALPKDASRQAFSDPAELASSRKALEGAPAPLPQPLGAEHRFDSELMLLKPSPVIPDASTLDRQAQTLGGADIARLVVPPAGAKANPMVESRGPSSSLQTDTRGPAADAATRTNHIAELFLTKGQSQTKPGQLNSAGDLPALQRIKEAVAALENPPGPATDRVGGTGPMADRMTSLRERLRSTSGEMDAMDEVDATKPAAGESKPSAAPAVSGQMRESTEVLTAASREKSDRYLKAAELYLQQGRYHRAVESFSLASLYNPNDRRVQLGRSHALFAAGEYVSSATFLAQAIELDPNQTLARIDLVNATGGPDLFLRRVTDLEQCARTTSTPDLQLLLAYIYYEMDRPDEAGAAIDAAEKGLGRLPAVNLLKDAIAR